MDDVDVDVAVGDDDEQVELEMDMEDGGFSDVGIDEDDGERDGDDDGDDDEQEQELAELIAQGKVVPEEVEQKLYAHDEPAPWRVQIVSVVTSSSSNSTALEYVQKVYDHIKAGTGNDKRITYQIQCFNAQDGDQVPALQVVYAA